MLKKDWARRGNRDDVEKVSSFVYLGDKLHAARGCGSAVVVRVRVGWMKLRQLSVVCYVVGTGH